jgi:trans-2,3-dihydro-3-hydroxyanthranilate isomerase
MRPFRIVDVFAEERYAGNQLAVVEAAAGMSTGEMAAVAAEFGFSETTFVTSTTPVDGGYDVRIFTPTRELPFAGHPTLGTAAVLREVTAADDPVTLNLPVGQVPVTARGDDDGDGGDGGDVDAEGETLWMTQPSPTFGDRLDRAAAAAAVSLDADALDDAFDPQVVSTGLPTTVLPVRDRAALTAATPDAAAYDALVGDREAKNVLLVCRDPRDDANDLAVRVFGLGRGVHEDPATGSSNGCLAAYAARYGYLADGDGPRDVAARVEQGYELGRPSLLHLAATVGDGAGARDDGSGGGGEARADDGVVVRVGGRVVDVAAGHLS